MDRDFSKEGCGAGLLLMSPTREKLIHTLRFDFKASNNEVKYEALITVMKLG